MLNLNPNPNPYINLNLNPNLNLSLFVTFSSAGLKNGFVVGEGYFAAILPKPRMTSNISTAQPQIRETAGIQFATCGTQNADLTKSPKIRALLSSTTSRTTWSATRSALPTSYPCSTFCRLCCCYPFFV